MLPCLSRLRLDDAPVSTGTGTGTERDEISKYLAEGAFKQMRVMGATDVAPNVLLGLPDDMWLHILASIDDADVCDEIGRICQSANVDPFKSMCKDDSVFDMLNRKMGLYGDEGGVDGLKAWAVGRRDSDFAEFIRICDVTFTARSAFMYACIERRMMLEAAEERIRVPADKGFQYNFRLRIKTFFRDRTPMTGAQARWLVGIDPRGAFEFIPGSVTTRERYSLLDLGDLPYDHPSRAAARDDYVMVWIERRKPGQTYADIAVPGYAEIAKMAVEASGFNFQYVPGWVDADSGYQPFPPCEGFAEIAKAAVQEFALNLSSVPGSQLAPDMFQSESWFPDPVENYTEIAKLAASMPSQLRYVPGSIDPRSGNQLRPPINDYYEIAEVHLRSNGRNLRWVPRDLEGYAALVRIALENNPSAIDFVPRELDFLAAAILRGESAA